MAGKPGRSGMRKRKITEAQGLRGAATLVDFPASLTEGVTGRGLAFVEEARAYDNWTPATRVLLREAAMLIDQLEAKRGKRGADMALRLLVAVLGALPFRNGTAVAKPESKWKAAA